MVIEVDGLSHDMGNQPDQDARRDAWLRSQGLLVLRFAAADVMNDLQSVVTAITHNCRS